jgi:hypothetical protein
MADQAVPSVKSHSKYPRHQNNHREMPNHTHERIENAKAAAERLRKMSKTLQKDLTTASESGQRASTWAVCRSPNSLELLVEADRMLQEAVRMLMTTEEAPVNEERLIDEARVFIQSAKRLLDKIDQKINDARSERITGNPVILVAEDEVNDAAILVDELSYKIVDHDIKLVMQSGAIPDAVRFFNPKILLLDRAFARHEQLFETEAYDRLIMAYKFRERFPDADETVVIVVSQFGEREFQQRFNSEFNEHGIYYYRKWEGVGKLVDSIVDNVLPAWPNYPTFL